MSDHESQRQDGLKMGSKGAFLLLCFLLVLDLSACGKKPGRVDPPPDVTEDHYPLIYPDPKTDPKP